MRTTMKVLAAVVLFSAACGGSDTAAPAQYSIAGRWVLLDSSGTHVAGIMHVVADGAAGDFTRTGGATEPLESHTFTPASADFSLSFGTTKVTGRLQGPGEGVSFDGAMDSQTVLGVWGGAH